MQRDERLDSWKAIAAYLDRDISTVIRWEKARGLPVHRVPGGKLGRVFAYASELDAWLATETVGSPGGLEAEAGWQPPPRVPEGGPWPGTLRRYRAALLGGVAAAAIIATAWTVAWSRTPAFSSIAIDGNRLVALDAAGRLRWEHRMPSAQLAASPLRWNYIADLDEDGHDEVLAAVEVRHPPLGQYAGTLLRLSGGGRLLWSMSLDDRLAFRNGEYGPPWNGSDLTLYRAGGQARIAWTVHQFTWWPSLLVTLDAAGRRLGTFVNSGWIHMAAPSADGRHLLLAGSSNSRRAYFFAVLDAERPSGRSPEPPGSVTECLNCPVGDPLEYVVFPRTDVGSEHPFPGDGPTVMTFRDGAAEINVQESPGPNIATVIYRLTPDLRIREARFGDMFWEWHRRLEREGRISHPDDACPHRLGVEVQRWTPDRGWEAVRLPVR